MPCNAHVQQSCVKDIYINEIKDPIPKKDPSKGYKASSGTKWPDGTLYSNAEKADILLFTVEDMPTLAPTLMAILFLKKTLARASKLTFRKMGERLRSGESTDVDYIWVREHDQLHRLTQSAKAMLLKTVTQRYDFEDETRWSREARDLMICSLAMDP